MKSNCEKVEGIVPCATGTSRTIHKASNKKKHSRNSPSQDKDKVEIKAYLNKLQELVPFMPKDKKLSKAEVISYVIEYIRELRMTLGLPPCNSNFYPDFEDMDILADRSSPAMLMTMAMMSRNGEAEHNSSVSTLATSISGVTEVSPATTKTTTPTQQSNLFCNRQPLGLILNPRNCTNGSIIQPLIQTHSKFNTC